METLWTNPGGPRPEPRFAAPERRRKLRHKIHTPAYVSVDGISDDVVRELNEILNISEDGLCIQSSQPLEIGRTLNLCLDLSGTDTYIYTRGRVVWSNSQGRTGISLPAMPESSRRQLKEWLFFNVIAACTNRLPSPAAPSEPAPFPLEPPSPRTVAPKQTRDPLFPPDYTAVLMGLVAVKREVEMLGPNLDGALQLIVDRALVFTHASGAAIAFSENGVMVCRATAGSDAPPVGTKVNTESGFSAACVRGKQPLCCQDSETDPRVDRETCRVLGIRSIAAVPIQVRNEACGLIEVFSPNPGTFGPDANIVLQHLAEAIPPVLKRLDRGRTQANTPAAKRAQPISAPVEPSKPPELRLESLPHRSRRWLLAAVCATVALVLLWLLVPSSVNLRSVRSVISPKKKPQPAAASVNTAELSFDGLRKLAGQGDAAAQFALGRHYATGDDVTQDYTEAARWFSLAAEQGHVLAQETLGAYYWAGRGVPEDLKKAYFWSVLAQAGGDESSRYRVSILASRMTHSQLIEVQQQANEWLKQHRESAGKPSPAH